ncbi:MAG: winged-helix domain-containing protein [Ruminococcaceae bacterium]|nr:winged-helix domain-containing protein [Oscillospiraceae bacterium]
MSELKRVVIISKNKELARLCEIELIFCGFSAYVSEGGYTDISKYSVAIVDIDTASPQAIRGECRVVGITSRDINIEEKGFRCDCVIKYPFLLSELRDIVCRFTQSQSGSAKNEGDSAKDKVICANAISREIDFCGRRIELSEYEFKVLERLCSSCGSAVDRAELSDILGAEKGNIVEVYICHLRKKLEAISHQKVIHTVRAKGYMTYWSMLYV